MNTVDFQTLFEALPGHHLVVQPYSSNYTVLAISDALLHSMDKDRNEVVGMQLDQLFSDNKYHAGQGTLYTSLQKVVQTKSIGEIDMLRLTLTGREDAVPGHYWSATFKPINGKDGNLLYILVTLVDATHKVTKKELPADQTNMEQAYQFFIQAPVAICIVKGPDYTVEMVNNRMLQLLGRTAGIIGQPVITALPEAGQQGLIQILDAVRKTKGPYHASGFPATLMINGIKEQRYVDLVFQPFFDQPGDKEVHHIFCIAHDITEQVLARKNAEEIKDRLNFRMALFEAQNDVSPDGILIVDVNGKILLHNQRFAEIWHMPQAIFDSQDDEAALRHATTQLINPEVFIARIRNLYQQHDQPSFDLLHFKDGRVIERHGAPVVASDGTYYGWAWYFRDSTSRIQQEQKFRNVVEQASDMIGIFRGEDLRVEVANDALLKVWQADASVLNQPYTRILPEMEEQGFAPLLKEVLHTGTPANGYEVPAVFKRKNGEEETLFFNYRFQPYHEVDGTITGVLVVATNVTQQVATRQKLSESEDRYRVLIEEAPIATALYTGREVRLQYANDIMKSYWGRTDDVVGKTILEILPEIEGQHFYSTLQGVYDTGVPYTGTREKADLVVDGKLQSFYFSFTYKPLRNKEGVVYGIHHTAIDVTEEVRAQQKIEESEARFRNMVQQAPIAIALTKGPDMIIESMNTPMLHIIGKERPEEVTGKSLMQVLPEISGQYIIDLINNVLQTGEPFSGQEVPVALMRDGKLEERLFNISYTPMVEDKKVIGVLHLASDVTEQVLAAKSIEISEARFRLLADAMPQLIWTGDAAGNLNYFNQAVYQYSGLSYDAIKEGGWLQIVHPDDREENVKRWMHAVSTGEDFIFNHRFKNKDGQYRWQLSRAIPQRDSEGHIQLWIGTSTDIHEHKLFEEELNRQVKERTMALENKNRELERSNANLEEFAHAASHDLKEPIRKILFFIDRLKTQLADRLVAEEQQTFTRIENAGLRMGALVDDLLLYSHVSYRPHEKEAVNLNEKLLKVMDDLELDIQQKNARITIGPLPVIMGYRRQLQQLFQNLLTNALKYHKKGIPPQVHISSRMVQGKEIGVPLTEEEMEQPYHLIQVQDNGIGFEQDETEKIFQMFQRLHGINEYSGTGVGLSIARKVMENHGGKLLAEAKPGIGATFHVYFPATYTPA